MAGMHQVTRLANGLTVITAEMPHMASVSVAISVGVGGRHEPAPLNGVSHFIEHMLFKGTRKRNAQEISQAVEGIGGHLNAFTTEEHTCFHARAGRDRLPQLLDVLTDMFLNSIFAPVEVDKERNVIKEELAMYLDQPSTHVQELLNELMWPDHPLGRPLTGTVATLDHLTRNEMTAYKRSSYVTANTVVVAAGRVKHKPFVKAVSQVAKRFPEGRRPIFEPATDAQLKPRVKLFKKQVEQTQIALGIRACCRHDDRRYALRLLNVVLGENMSSRLFQVVREDHGLAYSIHSGITYYDDTGALVVSAGLETDAVRRALKLILGELRRLRDRPVPRGELARARDYILGQIDLHLEGTENQMMWLGEQYLSYGRILSLGEVKRRLAQVTAADIRTVAREFLRPARMNLALVGPLKNDRGLARLLAH